MKRSYLAWMSILVLGMILGGLIHGLSTSSGKQPEGRKPLYYLDPMNPAHTSDKPGNAPCGMKMEPVYTDEKTGGSHGSGAAPVGDLSGAFRIGTQRQQEMGVRTGPVERSSSSRSIRTLGRVFVDENRIHRILTYVDGVVTDLHGGWTGSWVEKGQFLGSYSSRDIVAPQQTYFLALNARERSRLPETPTVAQQIGSAHIQVRSAEEALLFLGMSEDQIKKIAETREVTRDIEIRSPVGGIVVQRSIYSTDRVEKGSELYRIADIGKVWVLADVFEDEERYFEPGQSVGVRLPRCGRVFSGTVLERLPRFDASSRTLKLRIEVENNELVLRPDMFVDVELPISMPEALLVPAEAVLDNGASQWVFVDLGTGSFAPRMVKTGRRFDGRVEILQGLEPGERIALSGAFLLDSEARMKAAAGVMSAAVETGPAATDVMASAKDPVCGVAIQSGRAQTAGRMGQFQGKTYFFCSEECRKKFESSPALYVSGRDGR